MGGKRALTGQAQVALSSARSCMEATGITRLGDVTGFDRIGIPVMQAVRPRAKSLSVSQGKGRSRAIARLSALMEAMELHFAEEVQPDFRRAPDAAEQQLWNRAVAPGQALRLEETLEWNRAVDLATGADIAVPHQLVSMDFSKSSFRFSATSSGIAGRASRGDAIDTALMELRDRVALQRFMQMSPMERRAAEIAPLSIAGRELHWAVLRILRGSCDIRLWEMTPGEANPAFVAVIIDISGGAMVAPAIGGCCRPTRAAAAFGALVEAAQTRVTVLAGARDDLTPDVYRDPLGRAAELLLGSLSPRQSQRAAAPEAAHSAMPLRRQLVAQAIESGAARLAVVDLAPPSFPLSFVRVLAPGMPDADFL